MNNFKIIAITHKTVPLELIGKLHLNDEQQATTLAAIKTQFNLQELMYISTCNRVEILLTAQEQLNHTFLKALYESINSSLTITEVDQLVQFTTVYSNKEALTHLFNVASSLDSLVVGEREIITQVRKSYEACRELGLTGDLIRLVIKQTIETAKEIFTKTDIAKNPVSVVSLAYRQLRELGISNTARFIIVGAGETNTTMAKYLKKHQYANFTVFNRTLRNATVLANELKGSAYPLENLASFTQGFDVLITCTAASEPIITKEIYRTLLGADTTKKVIIDLAIPADVEPSILHDYSVNYINVASLKQQADANRIKREQEIGKCEEITYAKLEAFTHIYKERKVELAFGEIPKQLKNIKDIAIKEVFAKEIEALDENGKETLEKVLSYMEKKYNAVAMKTAKEALIEEK